MPDPIKEAFGKIKEDIISLKEAINILSDEIGLIKRTLEPAQTPADVPAQQTDRQITPAVRQETGGLKPQNLPVSIGNEGVPADRQTNQQTDQRTEKFALNQTDLLPGKNRLSQIDRVSEFLESLDAIKKELRSQFKKLTPQEMHIFSTIYQLEDQGLTVDYSLLSSKTALTESSIRDYVQKLVKKGIPVEKTKENNKHIILSISPNLRRMAPLDTLLRLREI
jgi:DNA-binding MarR family transcriptional regulator